ncbi:nitroreductase family protein [Acetobacterium bakii]|uniref:Putative nitroreductase TM1586 domain-containing protein n=1 Tax=Acetobacterium bakii TaxID=52689 RepID=A0A0L6TYF6_9FIRM|nr:nitroreductase family protein [Acetobacterium bakii]KNZ41291.1 hypothetical protein AKG39_13360 [Acetobacterium bakii]
MKFRDFTINSHSTREYVDESLEIEDISSIKTYLNELNELVGKKMGFSFILMENGAAVYRELQGFGGYGGLMIKSPHYIGLRIDKVDHEIEFLGAFYMQGIVKKLYEMNIGSCWISLLNTTPEQKVKLIKDQPGTIKHLLALGKPLKKIKKNERFKAIINRLSKYDQDPYGIAVIQIDEDRLSVVDTIYLKKWGTVAPFSEMEKRGVLDILYYVRNSPSFQNSQPCRLILQDGYAELAVINPENEENYTDAGIMMFNLHGLAKEMSFPSIWRFIRDESDNKEYRIVARIEM